MSDDISIPSPTYRVPRHSRGMDPATRRLAIIAACIGGTVLLVVGGLTMLNHRSHGVPVVQAESGPMRVKPANPGGLQVAGVNNDIFSGGSDTDVKKLAPPPQTPDPQALRAPPTAAPAPALLAQQPAAAPPAGERTAVAAIQAPPEATSPPRGVLAGSAPLVAAAKPAVAATAPLVRPAVAAAPYHGVAGNGPLVQLAALSSEQAARTEWERLVKRWPELLRGHRPAFSKIEHDGKTFWRVRTGGFDGVLQATMFCERLRAKGGSCSVADF